MLLAGVALSSCHDSDEPVPLPRIEPQLDWTFPDIPHTERMLAIPHYVSGYFWPQEFKVGCMGSYLHENYIIIYGVKGLYAGYDSDSASAREAYETLCCRNNDVAYERKEKLESGHYAPYCYLAVDVVGIDLVSDRAWGDRAAGASWADLCWLEGVSPYEHIQSGYTKYFDWTMEGALFAGKRHYVEAGEQDKKLILKPLFQCTPDDLRMLISKENPTYIHLSLKPANIAYYRFTVVFTLADGQVIRVPVGILT